MKTVRLGVIGVGGMGGSHARNVAAGKVSRCELAAVCDNVPENLDAFKDYEGVQRFDDSHALLKSGAVDAVLIATPHYDHTTIGIAALKQGLHVLVEKPISVHKADCEKLIASHTNNKQVFAAMFNQRTNPAYQKVRQLIETGELGTLTRVNWIITDWYRTEMYYSSGGWRATWKGEGGGVLLNQCPHQLDLLIWLCGMPSKVRGFCGLGRYHNIEVEDDVTAYLEYKNGATGVFITTTGEAPGTNRLEICGEMGKLIAEGGKLSWTRNEVSMLKFSKDSDLGFGKPPVWEIDIPVSGRGGQHVEIMQNFTDAILDKTPLIAPAAEGIKSVELGNAMLYSSLIGKPVDLPLDGKKFANTLKKLVRESTFVKQQPKRTAKKQDIAASFNM